MKLHHALRSPVRGVGLLDALIGLGLLGFGMLALAGFQTRMVAQTTEAQTRAVAMQFANDLLSTAQVDPDNLNCYTLPDNLGGCSSTAARANTNGWGERVSAALPGAVSAQSTRTGTEMTVLIQWTGKASNEPRILRVVTDVQ
jgi:Tfp pilus assembly protein PilV